MQKWWMERPHTRLRIISLPIPFKPTSGIHVSQAGKGGLIKDV